MKTLSLIFAALVVLFAPLADACLKADKYPCEWWREIPKEGVPSWEILPQDAGPGEVILSKRTELGVFSNFAETPFEMEGDHYASVEGFWQMMKFPEGPGDPRLQDPHIVWSYSRDQVKTLSGFQAKAAGDHANANMRALGIRWISFRGERILYKTSGQDRHYELVLAALLAKVEQNPGVAELLEKTKGLQLKPDHVQSADATPAYKYHEMLMLIREQL
jgi:hypothetical protein